jgi:hypothetical protein
LVADASEPCGDFLFGPVRVIDEVDELVFLGVEFGELFLEPVASSAARDALLRDGVVDGCGDTRFAAVAGRAARRAGLAGRGGAAQDAV